MTRHVYGISKRLWELRDARELSQKEVEEMTGIKREYLSKIETGELLNPTPATLKRILDAYNYKLSKFFRDIGE